MTDKKKNVRLSQAQAQDLVQAFEEDYKESATTEDGLTVTAVAMPILETGDSKALYCLVVSDSDGQCYGATFEISTNEDYFIAPFQYSPDGVDFVPQD